MIIPATGLQLPGDQLDIWVAVSAHVAPYKKEQVYEDMLSDAEREMFKSLRYPEHRVDYLVGRALLRSALAAYTGVAPQELEFTRNSFGKPELKGISGSPRFNLSLTDGVALVAVHASADLGVDVEYHGHGRSMLDVADQYFAAAEIAELQTLPKEEQKRGFFRYWTLKESLVKAKGEGMSVPLDSFSFRAQRDENHAIHAATLEHAPAHFIDNTSAWDFRFFDIGIDYTGAVSVASPISTICLRESLPMIGSVELDSAEDIFSHSHQDALSAAFC